MNLLAETSHTMSVSTEEYQRLPRRQSAVLPLIGPEEHSRKQKACAPRQGSHRPRRTYSLSVPSFPERTA